MRTSTLLILAAGTLFTGTGCSQDASPPQPEGIIDREAFIQAYMELRAAGVVTPDQSLHPAEADRILAEQGLTDQDLLDFVEAWGRDPVFMENLWTEVDDRMRESRRNRDEEPEDPVERVRGVPAEGPAGPGERRPGGEERGDR